MITAGAIKDIFTGAKKRTRMLLAIFQDHNVEVQSLIGKGFSEGTLERYETSLRLASEFLEYKYKLQDINIYSLSLKFVKSALLMVSHHP